MFIHIKVKSKTYGRCHKWSYQYTKHKSHDYEQVSDIILGSMIGENLRFSDLQGINLLRKDCLELLLLSSSSPLFYAQPPRIFLNKKRTLILPVHLSNVLSLVKSRLLIDCFICAYEFSHFLFLYVYLHIFAGLSHQWMFFIIIRIQITLKFHSNTYLEILHVKSKGLKGQPYDPNFCI